MTRYLVDVTRTFERRFTVAVEAESPSAVSQMFIDGDPRFDSVEGGNGTPTGCGIENVRVALKTPVLMVDVDEAIWGHGRKSGSGEAAKALASLAEELGARIVVTSPSRMDADLPERLAREGIGPESLFQPWRTEDLGGGIDRPGSEDAPPAAIRAAEEVAKFISDHAIERYVILDKREMLDAQKAWQIDDTTITTWVRYWAMEMGRKWRRNQYRGDPRSSWSTSTGR